MRGFLFVWNYVMDDALINWGGGGHFYLKCTQNAGFLVSGENRAIIEK